MQRVQRVLLVDDHTVVRSGLGFMLEQIEGFSVCGEAATTAQARTLAQRLQPELIVLDLFLGGADGIPLVAELRELAPRARILVFSAHDEILYSRRALLAGAHGYLMKSADAATFFAALRALTAGKHYVSDTISEQMLTAAIGAAPTRHPLDQLSNRELDVLRLTAEGKELGEIARTLGVSVKTVGTHRERLKNKLGLHTARELAREAGVLLPRMESTEVPTLTHTAGR